MNERVSENAAAPAPPRVAVAVQVVAGIVLTAVLLAMLEFTAGFFVPDQVFVDNPRDTVSHTVAWLKMIPVPQISDVELLWRNEPGAKKTQPINPQPYGHNDQWSLSINSEGFRGPERDKSADGSVYRILFLGDSITYGFNVDQDATYPRQLESMLATRYPGARFELINAGVPGWSWLQGLRFLHKQGLALKPDLLVMGHGTNDQFFPATVTDEERLMILGGPFELAFKRAALLASQTNIFRAMSRLLPQRPVDAPSRGCRQQASAEGSCRRVSLAQIEAAIGEVNELTKQHGIGLLVVNTDFARTRAVEASLHATTEAGIPFVDAVAEVLRRAGAEQEERARKLGLSPSTAAIQQPPASPAESKRVVFRVQVPDPHASYLVQGKGVYHPAFSQPLFDDGTHGDERSGDGVFSGEVELPGWVVRLDYKYWIGETPEFVPLPPLASTLGVRQMQLPGSGLGPVDLFGESRFKAEAAHPNRDGQFVVASLVADKLEEFPSFRNFVRGAGKAASEAGERH